MRMREVNKSHLRISHPDQALHFADIRIVAQRRMHHQRATFRHDGLQHATPRFVRQNENGS